MESTSEQVKSLYPFLHGGRKDEASENVALLNSVSEKVSASVDVKTKFFEKNAAALIETAKAIAQIYSRNNRLYVMGNGGSSCDAAHLAVEFQHPVTTGRPSLPAINLCVDTAMLTAVANDLGEKHIFVRQICALGAAGDGLVGFSTSGNSDNLIGAFRKGKELGLTTIGFVGGDGGAMQSTDLLDHCLVVETDSIHRIQETHVTCYHILWDLVHTLLADDRGLGRKKL
jgi:D-sedoheptulose 7-phosphate isomerase|tara:strand:+ start:687 stop:1373 length:687 start_codon:yes stop_codon:yes gene_type:complete